MHRTHAGHGSIWPAEAVEARASDQSTLTPERIAELRALLAKATPGPWRLYANKLRPQFGIRIVEIQGPREPAVVKWGGFDESERSYAGHKSNASLIVAAINSLPDLLDAAERLGKVGSAGDMFASTMPTTVDLAAANYARKTAERERDDALALASRAREDALREAGAEAKTAWLHYPRGEIGDADHDSALCEYVAERIALIDKPKDAPAPLPAAPVDGGEDA